MAVDARFQSETVAANGQQLHLVSAGEGPLVLLLHGFPESWYSWRHQLPALADAGYRAVALDLRGYGASSRPDALEQYTITELVGDCVGVVKALGESRAAIVGHDWGAPIAWTAAWTEPDIFHAVAGLSVPFGGRGIVALPGDPFGERSPLANGRAIAGEGRLFYQEYFNLPGGVAEREAEQDLRRWLTGVLYSFSGSPPLPEALAGADLLNLPDETIVAVLQGAMAVPEGQRLLDIMQFPEALPDWLSEADLDFFVEQFSRSGLTGPLNYYRNLDRDWELLAPYEGYTLDGPSLFIGGGRDIVTIWSREARERAPELRTDPRDDLIIEGCGHWIQQERPQETNAALIGFLDGL